MQSNLTLKEEALKAISSLPNDAKIDDILYRIYVINKVKKSQDAYLNGKVISNEELREEAKKW